MSGDAPVTYHYAVLRVVPHVYLGTFVDIGVLVHARTLDFLGMRAVMSPDALHALAPDVDHTLLGRYLECYAGICQGDPSAGAIALLPASERFHWLTAPRSDVLQASAVHVGVGDPKGALDELYARFVTEPGAAGGSAEVPL